MPRTIALLLAGLSICGLGSVAAGQETATPDNDGQSGTRWSDARLRQVVGLAQAGKKLTPKTWPHNARVAVCLSFDVDNQSYMLAAGETSPTTLSGGDYGAHSGLPRILTMLDQYEVPATFFVPAVSDLLHPEMIPAIVKSGRNEIGVHGWIHEHPPRLAAGEEERLMDQAIAYLTKASGKRPIGYRAPGWAFSQNTLGLLQKKGFVYDSSLQAMDEPYEILSNGKDTGLIELAIDWTLTETPFLGAEGHLPNPQALFQLYKDEFDGAYEEGTLFVLTLHPHFVGHRAPMRHLQQFVAYMKSKPGVWFATGGQVAEYLKSSERRAE